MLKVVLVKPDEILYEGLAESVFLPGEYGEFEVLTFHAPIMSVLKKGMVRIDERIFNISEGIAKFNEHNELIILAGPNAA
jgi:F-type H+-transporting ATPase subunit epsilon